MANGSGILTEMTIEDVRAFGPEVVVLGVGSTEPHGPALPYGTDFYQCDHVVTQGVILANRQGAKALMYPTLPIGNNANFQGFSFACRISPRTLMGVLLDVIEALEQDGIRKIVLFDGHGGNTDTMRATLRAQAHRRPPGRGAFVCMVGYGGISQTAKYVQQPGNHGGEGEVSMMLHVRGDLVRTDKIGVHEFGEVSVEALNQRGVYFVRPWHLHVPASCGGDQRQASAAKGKAIVQLQVERLASLLTELSKAPWGSTFPYRSG